jgi:Amt family ammonium transporter
MDDTYLWQLTASGLAFLVPAGLILVATSGLKRQRAWDAALGGLAAFCLACLGYWAVGFAFQFGSVGFLYTDNPELAGLVRGWIPLPEGWGIGWVAAGLEGWFLAGAAATPTALGLFLAHVPWAMAAAMLPVVALRGRAPAVATLIIALLVGGFVYPLAGNWIQGGGWLAALGRNLGLGHGVVDFGGAGSVFLVSASATLAALLVWLPRRDPQPLSDPELPSVHLPMLAVVGAMFVMAGVLGWVWASPVQQVGMEPFTAMRTAVNGLLYAAGGVTIPLLYTWFVTGTSDPGMGARGLVAGVIAGLAAGPFPGHFGALLIGLLAGGSVPFITFSLNRVFRLNDSAGIIATSGLPAAIGLLGVGIFADGAAGAGWQQIGVGSYLGVSGQGVTGLLAAQNFEFDFPGQLQAQIIGIAGLSLWGFISGSLICAPLGLVFKGIERATQGEDSRIRQQPEQDISPALKEARRRAQREEAPVAQEVTAPQAAKIPADEPRFQ